MLIRMVRTEPETSVKICEKHGVLADEVRRVLMNNKPVFKKVAGDQYVAVGLADRYLTIFFRYDRKAKEALITTAYPSSRRQIRTYRRLSR